MGSAVLLRLLLSKWLFPICFLAYLILAFFRIYLFTPINFDGSYFLFANTFNKSFANPADYSRLAGHILNELPSFFYSNYIGNSLKTAAYLYVSNVVLLPLTLIFISHLILPKDKKIYSYYALSSYGMLLISSLYFEVHEVNLANGLIWIIHAILLKREVDDNFLLKLFFTLTCLLLSITFSILFLIAPAIIAYFFKTKKWAIFKDSTFYNLLTLSALNYLLADHHNRLMPGTTTNFVNSISSIWHNHSALAVVVILILYFSTLLMGKYKDYIFLGFISALLVLLFNYRDTFHPWHLYNGRVAGILAIIIFYYSASILTFRPSPARTVGVVVISLLISSFYLSRWKEFQNEVIKSSSRFTGVVQYNEFTKAIPVYGEACTHWNSEMYSILIQHLRNEPVNFIIRKDPNSNESFYDWMGESSFTGQLRYRGVTLGPAFVPL